MTLLLRLVVRFLTLLLWPGVKEEQPINQARRSGAATGPLVARRMARDWWKHPPPYDPAWRAGIEGNPF